MSTNGVTKTQQKARDHLCLAVDSLDESLIRQSVEDLVEYVGYFKLNFAFTRYGPELIRRINDCGGNVFLDLKIHDIPNTVSGYGEAVAQMGVSIVTVHTGGGLEMMRCFAASTRSAAKKLGVTAPRIVGVTLLTSIDTDLLNQDLNIQGSVKDEVLRRAQLAVDGGLDGIVCSPVELPAIKDEIKKDLYYVTPGVRPVDGHAHDHKRIASYEHAIKAGSRLLVVGRDLLQATDKRATARHILHQIARVM